MAARYELEIADGWRWNLVLYEGDRRVETWLFDSYETALANKIEWEGEGGQ